MNRHQGTLTSSRLFRSRWRDLLNFSFPDFYRQYFTISIPSKTIITFSWLCQFILISLLTPQTTFRNKSDAARKELKLNENKLSSSGDERVQSGMHIEKCFITFQGDWFQKILHVCLLLIYRKKNFGKFFLKILSEGIWDCPYYDTLTCLIAHFSGCYLLLR